ncbi:MAG: 4-(cytidine 5'-diphospho)-2-C-methyl-D-erythritol kinase [Candidatus Pacebacteria bacterium]|nr:4-(cytidine 5'-diphospho)-2-C-methyl-D-erythritol kinase [Candidatus Paceibacterota bacterium]
MRVYAPAKLNLFLNVVARREDGYHDLETVFYPLPGLTDELDIVSGTGLKVTTDRDDLPGNEDNLCWKAASAFREAVGIDTGWHIHLRKHIPAAAGLAGGSSDAAAVLQALNEMYDHPLTEDILAGVARKLGADVPYFLNPVPCVGEGIGDVLTPVECRMKPHYVLVNAGFPVPTPWAYGHVPVGGHPAASLDDLTLAMAKGDLTRAARHMFNAFEVPVCRKFPVIELIMTFLEEQGALAARLTGSGPTVFGVHEEVGVAQRAASAVRDSFVRAYWVCESVSV